LHQSLDGKTGRRREYLKWTKVETGKDWKGLGKVWRKGKMYFSDVAGVGRSRKER
jgi:hypothetical protein